MTTILILLIIAVLGAMAYVRFTPVAADAGPARPTAEAPGDYGSQGGFYAVRAVTVDAEDVLTRLQTIIAETPRISLRTGSVADQSMIFETRSRVWGFPDMNHVWLEDGNLHIFAHLVYGRSDMAANRARVLGWLERLGPI